MIRLLRGTTERERLLHRLHSVVLVLNGFSSSQAGRLYGDSARSVAYWVKRFKESGIGGLEEEQRSGRPTKLTPAQLKQVRAFIGKQIQAGQTITAKNVSFFINQKFRVRLTVRQCRRIVNMLKEER